MGYGYRHDYSLGPQRRGASGPRIAITASSILESAVSGSTVGVLSVVGGEGTYTFTKTADPDAKFAVSGSNLNTAAALDFETAQAHSVTVQADNGVDAPITRTFTISVLNVFEAADLNALSVPADVSRGSTVNITGATSGSTITGTMPTGWTLDGAARTINIDVDAPTGSQSWSLTETLADSTNSPRVSAGSSEVSAGPTITSSDGDPASLFDNGNGTFGVVINSATVGTITQAQIDAGGWITLVEPVAGMSGNQVVLTTVGHIIYAGNVSIETDVEVLADNVVVGTSLPFDATAFPDATLSVRWSFTTGADNLVIESTARDAPLKIAQFRDSLIALQGAGAGTPIAWPVAQRTRQMTLALRIAGNINSSNISSDNVKMVSLRGISIQKNNTAGGQLHVFSYGPSYELFGPIYVVAAAGANQKISILAAVDYDGGLPGGEKFVLWASVNGAVWTRIGGHTVGAAAPRVTHLDFIGAQNAVTEGGNFDIENHLWASNVALDPAINWQNFFNADGTVKKLGSGVVDGASPVVYMAGDDFLTGNNRGTGGSAVLLRTPINVVSI